MRVEAKGLGCELYRWETGSHSSGRESTLASQEIVPEEGGRAVALVGVPHDQLRLPAGTTRRGVPWQHRLAPTHAAE